jgi:hypothetical protein
MRWEAALSAVPLFWHNVALTRINAAAERRKGQYAAATALALPVATASSATAKQAILGTGARPLALEGRLAAATALALPAVTVVPRAAAKRGTAELHGCC